MLSNKFYYFPRVACGDAPAGVTVSKKPKLPDDDFQITEYVWGPTVLWFVDDDEFDSDERELAYHGFMEAAR